ncbi:hypothetical protein LOTGIDRAFT_174652 [Lottia gigantea]|uniref:Uncharacterized protein n=1 Tax=Lottia gigantea TaxID=225164 RepID=V3ZZV3_LOTGI|nr:hypothetical protein LOTGIDRAFT_174652 [Lottia gigantea]ESO97083.1 hypothetical protein LOTGIDRAFT_174652 [Lottia gigantea]
MIKFNFFKKSSTGWMAAMDKSFVWLLLLLLYKGSLGIPQSDLTVPTTGSVNILATGTDYSRIGHSRPAAIGGSAITTQLDIGQPSSDQFVVDLMNNNPASNSGSNVALKDFGGSSSRFDPQSSSSLGVSSGVNILGVPGSAPVSGNTLSGTTQFVLTQPEYSVGLPPTPAPFELFQGESMSFRPPSSGISPDQQLIANMETAPYNPSTNEFGAFSPTNFNPQSLDAIPTLSTDFGTNPIPFKAGSSNFDLTNFDRSDGPTNVPSVIGTSNFPLPSFDPTSGLPTGTSVHNSNNGVLPDHAMDLPPSNNGFLTDKAVGTTNLNEPRPSSSDSSGPLPDHAMDLPPLRTGALPGPDSNIPIAPSTLPDHTMDLPTSPSTLPPNKYSSALPKDVMDLLTLNPGVLKNDAMDPNIGSLPDHTMDLPPQSSVTLSNHAQDLPPLNTGTSPNHAQDLPPKGKGTSAQGSLPQRILASPDNVAPQGTETNIQDNHLDLSSTHRGQLSNQDMTMINSRISEGFPDISLGFGAGAPTTNTRFYSAPTVDSQQQDTGSTPKTVDHPTTVPRSQTESGYAPILNNSVDLVIPSNRFVLEPTIDLTLPDVKLLPEHHMDLPTANFGSIPDHYSDIPPRYIGTTPRTTFNSASPNTEVLVPEQNASSGSGIPSLPIPSAIATTVISDNPETGNQGVGSTDRFGLKSSQPTNTVRTTSQLPPNVNTIQNVPKYQYGTQEPSTQPPTNVVSPKDQIHFHPSQQISTSKEHNAPASLPSNPSPSSPKTIISEQYKQFLASRLPGSPVAPNSQGLTPSSGMPHYLTSSAQQPPFDPRLRHFPQTSLNSQQTVLDPRQIYQQQLAHRAYNDPRFQLGHQATYAATNKRPQIPVLPVLSAEPASNNTLNEWQKPLTEPLQPRPTPGLTSNAARLMEQIRKMSGGVVPNQSNLQSIQEAMKRHSLKSLPIGTNPDTKTSTSHSSAPMQQSNDSQTANNMFQNIPTQTARQPTIQQPSIVAADLINPLKSTRNQKQQPSSVQNPHLQTRHHHHQSQPVRAQQPNQPNFVIHPRIPRTRVKLNHQDTHKSIYPPGSKNAEWAVYIQQNPGTTQNSEARKRQQQPRGQAHQSLQTNQPAGYQHPQQAHVRPTTVAHQPIPQQPRTLPAEVRQQIRQSSEVRQTARPTATNSASQANSKDTQLNTRNTATPPNARQDAQIKAKTVVSPTNRQNELVSKVSEIPGINTRPQFVGQPPNTKSLLRNEAARLLPAGAAPYSGGGGGGNDMLMTMMMMNQMQGGEAMPMAKIMEMMNPKSKPIAPIQLATPAPKTLKEALGYYDPVMKEFIPRGAGYGPEIIPKPTTPPPVKAQQMTPQQQLQAQVQLMAKLRQNPHFAKMQSQVQAQNPLFGKLQSPQLGLRAENQMMARLMAQQNQARNSQAGRPTPLLSGELRQQPVTSHALPKRRKKSVDVVGKARLKAFEHIKRLPRDELLKEYSVWRIESGLESSKKSLRQFLKFLKGKIYTVAPLFIPQQPIM